MQSAVSLIPIQYFPQSAQWFKPLRELGHAIWLDSGQSAYGRWDILSAAPVKWVETNQSGTRITELNGSTKNQTLKKSKQILEKSKHTLKKLRIAEQQNPFDVLKNELPDLTQIPMPNEIPFCGGVMGYFAYDLAPCIEPKLSIENKLGKIDLPLMAVGIYPWAIVQDHHSKKSWLVINRALAADYDFSTIEKICASQENILSNHSPNDFSIKPFTQEMSTTDYQKKFKKIIDYIQAGDAYQVNFAQRFTANYSGDPFTGYLKLREALPSPFSAYLDLPQGSILSLSPERFIKAHGEFVETQPIKGTIARANNFQEDLRNANQLQNSLKDRAENLMIVDLLRNDLSKTCDQVEVPKLFELQSFANVHHLVSTVTGKLKTGQTAIDLLEQAFPGGSITGAPKIRAMEIIAELEPASRNLYCGSIGYISSCGRMDTNIAIRTLVCDQDKLYCWGGGGIVADSICDTEYQESLAKVGILMRTLEKYFS